MAVVCCSLLSSVGGMVSCSPSASATRLASLVWAAWWCEALEIRCKYHSQTSCEMFTWIRATSLTMPHRLHHHTDRLCRRNEHLVTKVASVAPWHASSWNFALVLIMRWDKMLQLVVDFVQRSFLTNWFLSAPSFPLTISPCCRIITRCIKSLPSCGQTRNQTSWNNSYHLVSIHLFLKN